MSGGDRAGLARQLLQIALVAAAYFLCARLGLALAFSTRQVSAVWPPTGLALAALLLLGPRVAPGVFLGAFLANAMASEPTVVALLIACGNTATGLAGAWLLRRSGFEPAIERSRDVLALVAVAAATPLISATVGTATLAGAAVVSWARYRTVWQLWWVGDSLGILLGASLLFAWIPAGRSSGHRLARPREFAAFVLATLLVGIAVFAGSGEASPSYAQAYMAFPLLVWAALRLGKRETLLGAAVISACAVWGAIHGRGPFGFGAPDARLVLLDTFIGAIGCTALLLSAVIGELQQTQALLRRSHETMQSSEGRLRHIIEGSPFAVAMFDRDMRYLFASRRWLSDCRLDLTQEQIRGRSHYELFANFPEHWKRIHERCLQGEIASDTEAFQRPDGTVARLRWEVRPWRNDEGVISGILIYSEDITHHMQAQEALREQEDELRRSEARFRGTFDNAAVGIAHVALDGRWLRVNEKLCAILGYSRPQLLSRTFQDITHPDDLQEDLEYVSRTVSRAIDTYSKEKRYLRPSGEIIWANLTVSLMRDASGEPDYFISIVEDITLRKQAERALRERERESERARFFELSVDMVCVMDRGSALLEVNPAFLVTLGYSLPELLERPLLELLHPDDRGTLSRLLRETISSNQPIEFTGRSRSRGGEYRWLQWRCAPESAGRIYAVARDVTTDRQLVETLREQQASLSATLAEREVLLQEVHHRVKNNLQVMSSLINLQARQVRDVAALSALDECRARIDVIALIHQKLYQSKNYAQVPFAEYVRTLASNIFLASGRSDGSVSLQVDCEHVALPVDRAIPCGLILNELITNALKHAFPNGAAGVVRVSLRAQGESLLMSVADDGVGLPAHYPAKARSLGLELIAILVQQVSGNLRIERGRGTTFHVQCPFSPAPQEAEESAA